MVRRRADLRRRQQKLDAANSVPPVTREQLIVAAVIAYWCEGSKDKPYARRESLKFCNSDVRLIQLWLRFLNETGGWRRPVALPGSNPRDRRCRGGTHALG